MKSLLGLAAILILVLYGVGCGGSGNSSVAPKGTYVVNVTASGGAGSTAKTVPVVVTVAN